MKYIKLFEYFDSEIEKDMFKNVGKDEFKRMAFPEISEPTPNPIDILQKPISNEHKNAMFFVGIIAKGYKGRKYYTLETYQEGEISYEGETFSGRQIIELAKDFTIRDSDIEDDDSSILVDKYFAIMYKDTPVDEDKLIFDNYDDAILKFKKFLNQ